jgi:hypothetical protein
MEPLIAHPRTKKEISKKEACMADAHIARPQLKAMSATVLALKGQHEGARLRG